MAAVAPKNIYAKHMPSVSAWSGLLQCPIFEPKPLRKHGWRRCIISDERSTSRRADEMQIKKVCCSATRPFRPNPRRTHCSQLSYVPKMRLKNWGTRKPHYNFPALNAMNHIQKCPARSSHVVRFNAETFRSLLRACAILAFRPRIPILLRPSLSHLNVVHCQEDTFTYFLQGNIPAIHVISLSHTSLVNNHRVYRGPWLIQGKHIRTRWVISEGWNITSNESFLC
jgi:hypothetical protein